MEDRYYTIEEVAELFKVTRAGVYKWMKAGQLKYVLVGSHRRIPASALSAFIRQGQPEELTEEGEKGNSRPTLIGAYTAMSVGL